MNLPRFLTGAALLFWGWQTGLLIWAAPMALILEISQVVRWRWELSLTDLKRIWNLCAVLFFGAGIILYSSETVAQVPLKFVQWLPFPFFPIMLAQAYGGSSKIPLSVFSWFLRRRPNSPISQKAFNISYLYFGICLLAASATMQNPVYFYPGICVLIGIALLLNRPRRLPQPLWIVLIGAVAFAGFVGQQQLHALHGNLETSLARWFVRFFNRPANFGESRTAIGKVGHISLSGEIVLRVRPEEGGSPPPLLRELGYDIYKNGIWRMSQVEPTQLFVDTNEVAVLLPPKKLQFSAQIATYLSGGQGILALPNGTFEVHNMPGNLKTNSLGAVKIEDGPGLVDVPALYGPGKTIDSPPAENDFAIPNNEKIVLAQVARELDIGENSKKTERQKIEAIAHFFRDKFVYSLDITRRHVAHEDRTALGQFLTVARSGHCEYFATASVMLLRQARIPARYMTGYLVDDSERKGKTYRVRQRDAHAWTLVYRVDKGIWEELDTTPPTSDRAMRFKASPWESISDFFSNLKFQFAKWRWSKTHYTTYLKWILVPLILFFVWRILFHKRQRKNNLETVEIPKLWPGMDSEFYLIEQKMDVAGQGRSQNETVQEWEKRLPINAGQKSKLDRIIKSHQRLRFDPQGLPLEARESFRAEIQHWLTEWTSQPVEKEKMA